MFTLSGAASTTSHSDTLHLSISLFGKSSLKQELSSKTTKLAGVCVSISAKHF